ncbi:DoxX-like family protein [Nakamurella panacisegetis]|uniref:DoxX-like family protein n=1 Tax=Nakamurella panacisegetis TaxID=1090615 RepID=A0A1H0RVA2_9ACTN|nr:DoxX family protein [Nakamurella panacisegetis]SDP33333.1 DoxX-like family protein [Nakamurella panacisegetis]
MFIAAVIVSALLVAVLLGSGRAKLVREKAVVEMMATVGFPEDRLWLLAGAEFVGAVGLVGGLFWAPLGIAAAIGVILYFAGAIGSHLRVRDYKGIAPATGLLLFAVSTLVLRVASLGR